MSESKNLVIFTDSYPYGSAEPFLSTELEYLSKDFSRITIIPLNYGTSKKKREVPANVKIHSPILNSSKNKVELMLKGIFNLSPITKCLKELRKGKALSNKSTFWSWGIGLMLSRAVLSNRKVKNAIKDNLNDVFYFYWGVRSSFVLPLLPQEFNKKIAVRFHGSDTYEETNGGFIPLRKEQLTRISTAFFCSNFGKNYIANKYPFMESKSALSRLGVVERGVNQPSSDGIFRILTLSNMVPLKRLHLVAEALSNCKSQVIWTHIGDGETREAVEAITQRFPKNVTANFMGRLPNNEVMSYLTNNPVDLFVNVSSSEGVPVSIMEALSMGIPVLATAVGGTPEIVDSEVGLLVNPHLTPAELLNSISSFIENSQQMSTFREAARKRWEERCNADTLYKEFSKRLMSL